MKKKLFISLTVVITFLFSLSVNAQTPDRTKPPELPAPSKLKTQPVEKFELSNGLKVYMMEKHDVPLVQLNLIIKAGTVNDPENKTGLASLALDMLDEGAAGKDALEIADALDYLGVRLSTGARQHFSSISLHSPLSKLDDALKIVSDVVLKPDFPQKELERKVKNLLTTLTQWHDQPNAIASIAFDKLLFTDNHPYGRMSMGDENSIRSFKTEDLKNFHSRYFKANNAYIVAVGDIKKNDLAKKLEQSFGKWEKGTVQEEKIKEPAQVNKTEVCIIDKPGSPQSVIYIGRIGAARQTDDYFNILVMNTILGGSFGSRINQNLREKHGYTYGASTWFTFKPVAGPFQAYSSVQTEVTDSALTEFFKEFKAISSPVSQSELEGAKNYEALSFPAAFQSVSNIANQIIEMVEYKLPENYFSEYIPNLLSVKSQDVTKAAKKYVVPDQMLIVVVGDRAKIEQGIKKLNLGEIKYFTIDDILGKTPTM